MKRYYLRKKEDAVRWQTSLEELGYTFKEGNLVEGWEDIRSSTVLIVNEDLKEAYLDKGMSDPSIIREG